MIANKKLLQNSTFAVATVMPEILHASEIEYDRFECFFISYLQFLKVFGPVLANVGLHWPQNTQICDVFHFKS